MNSQKIENTTIVECPVKIIDGLIATYITSTVCNYLYGYNKDYESHDKGEIRFNGQDYTGQRKIMFFHYHHEPEHQWWYWKKLPDGDVTRRTKRAAKETTIRRQLREIVNYIKQTYFS